MFNVHDAKLNMKKSQSIILPNMHKKACALFERKNVSDRFVVEKAIGQLLISRSSRSLSGFDWHANMLSLLTDARNVTKLSRTALFHYFLLPSPYQRLIN